MEMLWEFVLVCVLAPQAHGFTGTSQIVCEGHKPPEADSSLALTVPQRRSIEGFKKHYMVP